MKVSASSAAVALTLLVLPSQARSEADSLCAPLREFAAAVGPDEHREIVFRTSWGGGFKDDPGAKNSISSKRCEHGGYDKAKVVCGVLMEDASVEFGNVNTMRAVVCISPDIHFPRYIEFEHGEFSLNYGTEDRGANISISFEDDPKIGGAVLRIIADGY
jgi:hypothetical protein